MNSEHGKNIYDSIEIPDALSKMVAETIASKNKEEIRKNYENSQKVTSLASRRPIWKNCAIAAAVVLMAGTAGLNTSPAFAAEMQKLPIIGQLAQVLTFRSFEGIVDGVELHVNIPEIRSNTDAKLPEAVNQQIQALTAEYETQAKAELAECKETFFANGGTEAEWADRTASLFIDYEVKYFDDAVLSLQVTTEKTWVSAEEAYHFYNIDLKNDTELTLETVLGENYIERCNTAIIDQINERLTADENAAFFGYGDDADSTDGFKTITEETAFYLNEEGKAVISFPEYSIAPGYMGIQEFIIP